MSINFSYEIIAVDESAKCMEVRYTAEGHPVQHIGARLPYTNETVEDIILMYAPINFWLELKKDVITPAIGLSGHMPLADQMEQEKQRLQELASRVNTTGAQTL
jgi:hypothetical protein